ncbi:MAG TPA: replicative DNA helicase [Gemmatimonadaceae bacterium]|jgi:replicative DNA helicase|nr:replicative DNA helicase [Gemmatimonadaceae bacterium]
MSSSLVDSSITASLAIAGREPSRDRRPPYSEDAEQAVIAAMLMDADAIIRATEFVDDSMFYREAHRRMFRAMLAINQRGDVVDPLTLSSELEQRGELEAVGGKDYITVLLDAVPTAANVEYHAKIVRERALVRRLIEAATEIVTEAYEGKGDAGTLLDHAEQRIFQISQQRGREGFRRMKELLWPAMERIEELATAGGSPVTGVPSGFTDLDRLTLGFQPSELIIVAARPSMGKTAFTLNIAQYVAIEAKTPVAIFSLEMGRESLVQRMLASEGYIDAQRLRNGRLTNDDFTKLTRAAGLLGSAPIWVDDTAGITTLEIRSRARRLKTENDIGLLIIDYLQLIQGPSDSENRTQEISYISRSLKILARELKIPVVALSQLSRAPEQRTGENRRPQLSDLRESGAIEQDADVVMFLFRPEYYEGNLDERGEPKRLADGTPLEGLAECIVGKQRNGPTDTVRLYFHKQYTRFDNYTPRQPK